MRRIAVVVVAAVLVLAPVTVPARWILPSVLFLLLGTAVVVVTGIVYRCVAGMRADARAEVTLRTPESRRSSGVMSVSDVSHPTVLRDVPVSASSDRPFPGADQRR